MARRRPPTVHGLAIVDKPAGVTSHDVVGMLRRRLGERRVGHAGTLDPSATGVLVVGVGSVTRLLRFVGDGRKRYTGEVVLGVETDSLDADGAVVATHDMAARDRRRRPAGRRRAPRRRHRAGPADGVGDPGRRPPPARAGPRGHRGRARAAAGDRRPLRRRRRPPTRRCWPSTSSCSGGTYVRTLAADLGHLLGGGAHLRNLRRTAVGPYTIDEAAPPDECELLAADRGGAGHGRSSTSTTTTAALVANGRVLPAPDGAGPWAIVGPDGRLLAVYEPFRDGQAKPAVVLA